MARGAAREGYEGSDICVLTKLPLETPLSPFPYPLPSLHFSWRCCVTRFTV
jgi:hypothetical protein